MTPEKISIDVSGCVWEVLEFYTAMGGQIEEIEEGCLGYGIILLHDQFGNLPSFELYEYYKNANSSGHRLVSITEETEADLMQKMLDSWED